MRARELIDWVETNLRLLGFGANGLPDVPGDADILMFLDRTQKEYARDLGLPTRYVKDVDPMAPFNLPAEAVHGSLKFAEREDCPYRVRILTVSEANDFYPGWEKNEHEGGDRFGARLVVYDPSNISAPVYPVGFRAGEELHLTYQVSVPTLVLEDPGPGESLEPWACLYPEYHILIARLVTFEMTMAMATNEEHTNLMRKASAYYSKAQEELDRLFAYSRQDYYLPGTAWPSNVTRPVFMGQHGRFSRGETEYS